MSIFRTLTYYETNEKKFSVIFLELFLVYFANCENEKSSINRFKTKQ